MFSLLPIGCFYRSPWHTKGEKGKLTLLAEIMHVFHHHIPFKSIKVITLSVFHNSVRTDQRKKVMNLVSECSSLLLLLCTITWEDRVAGLHSQRLQHTEHEVQPQECWTYCTISADLLSSPAGPWSCLGSNNQIQSNRELPTYWKHLTVQSQKP